MPKQQNENTETLTDEDKNFIHQFVRAYESAQSYNVSPTVRNNTIKDMNMNPVFKDRDTVEKMVANPKGNEKGLRELSQHIENVIMPIKRASSYYSSILSYDYTLIPINSTLKTMKTTAFKKAETKVYDWLDALNPKKAFGRLSKGSLIEDGKFYYLRESDNGVALQEMPTDYCMIVYEDEVSYRYAFNMNYFLKTGVEIEEFAPEFMKHYLDIFVNNKNNDKNKFIPNWVELDPKKAFVFKFDMLRAGLTPPLIGLFIDAIEIDTYRNLKKSKVTLEAYKLIVGSIPRHKENKTGNSKNNFALTADMAAQFSAILQNSLPEGVDFKTTPFDDIKAFEFEKSANKEDVSGAALKNLVNNSGSSQVLSLDKPTQSTVKASQKIDESFVKHLYYQAEDFINYQLRLISPKYNFRIKFEGTIFDVEERQTSAKELASLGIITDRLGASLGYNPREFDQAIMYMQARGYPEKLIPLVSAFQTSGSDKKGAPEKKDSKLSDSGAVTKDHELND